MRAVSKKVKDKILADDFYEKCCRRDEGDCAGGISLEHALIYAGRQIDEVFAILPVCEYHHAVGVYQDGGKLDKKKHEWIAISRMTDEDMLKYPKRNWTQELSALNAIYGEY